MSLSRSHLSKRRSSQPSAPYRAKNNACSSWTRKICLQMCRTSKSSIEDPHSSSNSEGGRLTIQNSVDESARQVEPTQQCVKDDHASATSKVTNHTINGFIENSGLRKSPQPDWPLRNDSRSRLSQDALLPVENSIIHGRLHSIRKKHEDNRLYLNFRPKDYPTYDDHRTMICKYNSTERSGRNLAETTSLQSMTTQVTSSSDAVCKGAIVLTQEDSASLAKYDSEELLCNSHMRRKVSGWTWHSPYRSHPGPTCQDAVQPTESAQNLDSDIRIQSARCICKAYE